MSEEYKTDRKWSDEIFYDKNHSEFKKLLNEAEIFGPVSKIEPASKNDDNIYNVDTYINNIPIQVRLQRLSCKKSGKYYPTLRYGRPENPTEVFKMIKMYKKYRETGDNKMPIYLLWSMIDEKLSIVELKLINLHELFEDRMINVKKHPNYKMYEDSKKFIYKENQDGTSFLAVKTDKYTKYHFVI
jgi:hypothetical protein